MEDKIKAGNERCEELDQRSLPKAGQSAEGDAQ